MNARIMRLLFGTLIGLALALVILVWPAPAASICPPIRWSVFLPRK